MKWVGDYKPVFSKEWLAHGGVDYSQDACAYMSKGKNTASTLSLSVLVAIEMFNALNALSEDGSLLQMPPWANPYLLLAMAVSFGLHFVILYVPAFAATFSIVPLTYRRRRLEHLSPRRLSSLCTASPPYAPPPPSPPLSLLPRLFPTSPQVERLEAHALLLLPRHPHRRGPQVLRPHVPGGGAQEAPQAGLRTPRGQGPGWTGPGPGARVDQG